VIAHDGELQLALRRIAQWRKQRECVGDRDGLRELSNALDAVRQSVLESRLAVLRQRLEREQ
jgi:hypothetical protein